MEKLLAIAAQQADQAELYTSDSSNDSIKFVDGKLDKADTSLSSGLALRVIKNGKVGLAHTRNMLDPEALVHQAVLSASNGMEVGFEFPRTEKVPEVQNFVAEIEALSKKDLIAEGKAIIDYIQSKSDSQIDLDIGYGSESSAISNTAGTNLSSKDGWYFANVSMVFPGTASGLNTYVLRNKYGVITRAELDEMIELYQISKQIVVPETKQMPVIFYPTTLPSLLWRFKSGMDVINIHNKISPLCNRIGEQILSAKFSMWQDPFDPEVLACQGFDGEGTPTRKLVFFEQGVFKAIPTDLNYARKLGLAPTGNGLRGSIESSPSAGMLNTFVQTGDKSLEEMIAGISEGLIVHSLMGAHSGNILNGDYSVGVATGFMIKNGKLVGRVKDCLLSGNVYENFKHIGEIENKAHNLGSGKLPSILIDGVSVAGK